MKSATYTGDGNFQTAYSYDKMGNIKTIQRYGVTAQGVNDKIIDNLTLDYTGNQLNYITDAGPNVSLSASADFKDYSKVATAEYTFNKNGAMTKDLNKGISSVAYNSLNLPLTMDIKSPVAEARNEYTYTATGAKLKVVKKWNPNYSTTPVIGTTINTSLLTLNETTDYIGNKIYENGILKRILTDNGYIEGNTYYFYIKDHLGNNRVVANASGGAIQSTQYYPFGMAFAEGTTTEQGKQPYKYNGKELDQSHGINQYDYQARFLDNAYGGFTTPDPHSENYYSWSPYVYVGNNPMRRTDPNGKDWRDFLHAFVSSAEQRVEGYANIVAHPINTVVNMATAPTSTTIGEALVQAADQVSMGAVSSTVNGVQAVAAEINGGNGSATGAFLGGMAVDVGVAVATGKAGEAVGKGLSAASKGVAQSEMTTVGRWMSKAEYSAMENGTNVLEGAGGQTFVTKGGSSVFPSAAKGSIYAEFEVPANSLLQGGKEGWFKMIGPNASKSQQYLLQKQGGTMLPQYQNLSPIIKTK